MEPLSNPPTTGTTLQCMDPLSNPPTTGTTLQWNLSPIHPLVGPLYSRTSLQSTHYWDHSTVEPLSNPPTTGTTLQWNLSPIHPPLGPLYSGTSLQSTHYWDHSTVEPLSNPPITGRTFSIKKPDYTTRKKLIDRCDTHLVFDRKVKVLKNVFHILKANNNNRMHATNRCTWSRVFNNYV